MIRHCVAASLLVCLIVRGPVAPALAAQTPAQGPILRGRLVDDAGKPVPGVHVVLYGGLAIRFRGQEAITDTDGRYRFDPLKTGAPMLGEHGRGQFYTGVQFKHDTHVPADGTSWRDIRVPTTDRHEEVLDVTMTRGGKIRGVLVDAENGNPLADQSLRLYNGFLQGKEQGEFFVYATTDKDGRFESDPLLPDHYVVDINENDFQGKYRYPKIGKVKVEAGETAEVKLTTRERPDLQDPFVITGTAKSVDGKSMVYGGVSVRIVDGKETLRSRGGGIDGRNVFGLRFGPTQRGEPTTDAPYGVGTRDIELEAGNNRIGYELAGRTPAEPLRISDDPNQPELDGGIRYILPNRPVKFELIFDKIPKD